MGYSSVAFRGVSWITLLRVITRGATFIRLAILGRLLTPTQFGYFGIASLLLTLLEILTETGINVFLVQLKGNIKEYISSAWIVSIVRGLILSLIIFASAPIIATFFNSPEAIGVLQLIAVVPFIRGFINPSIIIYQKNLLFGKEFLLRSTLFFVDVIISIIFGFILRNATAFVYGLIASAIIEVSLSYLLIKPWPKIEFEFSKVITIVKRGVWVTLNGIFLYFADNGDNLVVGKILGSAPLGIYQVAYKFSTLPISEITNVINQVVFPIYTKFSENRKRLLGAFIKTTVVSSIGSIFLGGAIFFLAEPLIRIFMGNQWVAAIPAVKILAFYGIIRTVFGNAAPLFLSVGKQNYVAGITFVRLIGLAIFIIPLVTIYGMVGAAYAMLVSMLFEIPLILFLTLKIFLVKSNPSK